MFSHHLVGLLRASRDIFFASLGTTILGFAAMLLDSLASIGISLWRILRSRGLDAMRQHWRDTAKIALQTTFLVTLSIYSPIFIYSVGRAIWNDHESLARSNLALVARLAPEDSELSQLGASLKEDESKIKTLTLEEPKDSLRRRTIQVADE